MLSTFTGDTPPDLRFARSFIIPTRECNEYAATIDELPSDLRVVNETMICNGYLSGHHTACYVSSVNLEAKPYLESGFSVKDMWKLETRTYPAGKVRRFYVEST